MQQISKLSMQISKNTTLGNQVLVPLLGLQDFKLYVFGHLVWSYHAQWVSVEAFSQRVQSRDFLAAAMSLCGVTAS